MDICTFWGGRLRLDPHFYCDQERWQTSQLPGVPSWKKNPGRLSGWKQPQHGAPLNFVTVTYKTACKDASGSFTALAEFTANPKGAAVSLAATE